MNGTRGIIFIKLEFFRTFHQFSLIVHNQTLINPENISNYFRSVFRSSIRIYRITDCWFNCVNMKIHDCFLQGLFSKAIAQSGTNLAAWSQPAHKGVAVQRATKVAEMFNCHKPKSWPQTLDCLRQVSAENITASFYDFFVSKYCKLTKLDS